MSVDVLVVGAGISGCVLAERFASVAHKRVLVIDRRGHIGGNCHDCLDEAGILIPLYGPHMFHTSYENVWQYLGRFTQWQPYKHRVKSYVDGMLVPVPVNIETVNRLFGLTMSSEGEMLNWLRNNTQEIKEPKTSEDVALMRVGRALYEKMFKNYTKKQWDRWPDQLDASLIGRIPVRTNFDDGYFSDKYEGVPARGYTSIFQNILDHKNIDVMLNIDYLKDRDALLRDIGGYETLIFTGRIDAFFDYRFGRLQYRSLEFEYETLDMECFQSNVVINYPNDPNDYPYMRVTEPKLYTGQRHQRTTIIREYPTWEGDPYYPVPSQDNLECYMRYEHAAKALEKDGTYLIGRLANYKHLNMDQAFKNALDLFAKIRG
ncbi:udp-galactopyranose mutase [Candidatus Magnetobacterium bavaricum]|uniref:Udp-galactopyranose mutase n=1 Tax=Candidatus Magnetobacterium bavaricum TaxID=29290 RepID=A0A0F3GLL9_9BACT|nr:udp-galactopyranose mutase [Candidatus Magnetobacterium bavaricum]